MIQLARPTPEDIEHIGSNLRAADLREASTVKPELGPVGVLQYCVDESDKAYCVRKDGSPVVVFGSKDTEDFLGIGAKAADIWLLGTDEVTLNKVSFLKLSRKFVEDLARPYDYLWNVVDSRNRLHLRWLRWLGFTFPFTHEINGVEFFVAVRYS